jgi:LCP family protein required for cell wall assembly
MLRMQGLTAPDRPRYLGGYLEPDAPAPFPPEPPERGRGWRVLGWVSVVLSVLLVVASLTAYGVWRRIEGRIEREDVDGKLGDDRPAKLNNSMNILLMGSDSRAGENAGYGSEPGQRSDTTILLHLSPGGDQAIGMSFPRDTVVRIPSCEKDDGTTVPPRLDMLNSAYATGGPACTWKTIEAITDIHIDHYVEVDFSGFKRVVDALGGVEICVPRAVNDPRAKLYLRKGRQVVRGEQALGYVRTRTGGLGDGSDLSRIQRQQAFMASVVKKATDKGMLADPGKTYSFLSAVASSIKTDDRLTMSAMQKVAGGLRGMSAGKVRFVTVPVGPYPPDPRNRVQVNTAQAGPLFDAIRRDNAPPQPSPAPGQGTEPQPPKMQPSQVRVAVYNATNTDGLAQRTADQLKEKGFQIASVGTWTGRRPLAKTRILHGEGARPQAEALAAALPGHPPKLWASARPGLVYLVVGADGAAVPVPAKPVPKVPGEIRADQDVCAAT